MLEALTDNIAVDAGKCTACGICVETCPMDNLRLNLSPCRQACPLGVNAQGYVRLIARGEEREAVKLLRETLPFPGILARVCSQPCESACHHNSVGSPPVAIRALKRYLADLCAGDEYLPACASSTGKSVAVLGAGPAGMLAAHDLRARGHRVVMFEAGTEPGGMLRWAIPEFRLPSAVLEREIGLLGLMGVEFQCGAAVDGAGLDRLKKQFQAVLIATGCGKPRELSLDGGGAAGVYYALPFLRAVRGGIAPAVGKRVVVIGGGNAAVDAAQTALRCGAREVSMVCLESEAEMPAFAWAMEGARAEGVGVMNSWGPLRFLSDRGRLAGVEFSHCSQVFDADGRFAPCFDSCRLMTLEADTVIVAAGQAADPAGAEEFGIAGEGGVAFDPLTLETRDAMVFAAGDLVSGPSSVVHAMASGRRAAESVHRLLAGEPMRYGRGYPGPVETQFDIDVPVPVLTARAPVPERPLAGRDGFDEVEMALDVETARLESRRCFSCGRPWGRYRTCWFCLPCEIECPHKALTVEIPYLLR